MKPTLLLPALLLLTTAAQAEPPNNLGFFAEKVRQKQPVFVTAIGGSITMGSGASSVPKGYIWQTVAKLGTAIKDRGDAMKFQWAPAGGTNSTYGAYRVGAQLLTLNPDLLIVEFAVNDGANPEALDGMEGIVRQALKQNPKIGIVFFETTSAKYETDFYSKDQLPPSIVAHRKIAEAYNIPVVNTGPAVHQGIIANTFTPETFWKDGTHPNDLGHTFYADTLAPALIAALDQAAPTAVPAIPAPVGTGTMENARFQPIVPATSDGWAASDKDWFASHKWSATEAKPITFPLSGNKLSLLYRGSMKLRWTDAAGTEQIANASQPNPTPSPVTFAFPGGSLPEGTIVTAEPIPGAGDKVNAEIYGTYSVAK